MSKAVSKAGSQRPKGTPKVMMYGMIDSSMAAAFAFEVSLLRSMGVKEFDLHINSKGGSVMDGVAIFSTMRTCGMKISVYVDGVAASMASVIAFGGDKLFMNKYARLMMHRPKGGGFGSAEELRIAATEIERCEADMTEIYSQRTGLTKEEVVAKFLNGNDNYYNAQQALDEKLIDGVYEGTMVQMAEDAAPEAVYDAFQVKLEASMKTNSDLNNESNMNEVTMELTPELIKLLGVSANAEGPAVVSAIKKLSVRASNAENQVKELQEEAITGQVTSMLEGAKKKGLTAKEISVLASHYENDPEGLKEVLEARGAFVSVTSTLKPASTNREGAPEYSPEVKALVAKGWDTLMTSGEMAELKAKAPEAYLAMYEGKYGYKPNESPVVRG